MPAGGAGRGAVLVAPVCPGLRLLCLLRRSSKLPGSLLSSAFALPAVNPPSPALVTQDAARRLPRPALWLLCLAYVLAGFIGRQPWKGGDLASFGFMRALAEGRADWLAPTLLQKEKR